MQRNPAFGQWTESDTNWSVKDRTEVQELLKETPLKTSYQELLDEYEAKLVECK